MYGGTTWGTTHFPCAVPVDRNVEIECTHNAYFIANIIHNIVTNIAKNYLMRYMLLDYFMSLHVLVFIYFFFKFGLQIRLYHLKHLHFLRDNGRFLIKIGSVSGLIKGKKDGRHDKRNLQSYHESFISPYFKNRCTDLQSMTRKTKTVDSLVVCAEKRAQCCV